MSAITHQAGAKITGQKIGGQFKQQERAAAEPPTAATHPIKRSPAWKRKSPQRS